MAQPSITFGLLVFNGQPFVRHSLEALYPHADQIVIVEGAEAEMKRFADATGHSTDGSLEAIERFQRDHDPDGKIDLITRTGGWASKDEMSQALGEAVRGEYLWLMDVDEFYLPKDIEAMRSIARRHPWVDQFAFTQKVFWGNFDTLVGSWSPSAGRCARLFKWGKGHRYVHHQPPTIINPAGRVSGGKGRWLVGEMAWRGIAMYHYSQVFPRLVTEQMRHCAAQTWGRYSDGAMRWLEDNFLSPIRWPMRVHNVHTHPSWLERFKGTHPPAIESLINDLAERRVIEPMRDMSDVAALLSNRWYRALVSNVKRWPPASRWPRMPHRFWRWLERIEFNSETGKLKFGPIPRW